MEKGIGSIVINVAYVTNESIIEDSALDFDKCKYVAICDAVES